MWSHKKRGTFYTIEGTATVQVSGAPLTDDEDVVVYRGEDGRLWVRRSAEFHDGRFERVTAE